LSNFDFESTPSARMMRLHRRHNVALGGGISMFRVAKLIAASSHQYPTDLSRSHFLTTDSAYLPAVRNFIEGARYRK
jgi:hypothetical protein